MTLEKPANFGPDARLASVKKALTGSDIIGALELEIHAQYKDKGGLKGFTKVLGVDYLTYRRYIVGERKMSADLLMDSLAALAVDPVTFFTLLRTRVESGE